MSHVFGVILIAIGVIINVVISRNRFYRRGPGGLQHYSRYSIAVTSSCLEALGRLFGLFLIIAGLGLLILDTSRFPLGPATTHHEQRVHKR